jgi:hypothetical protein
MIYKQFSPSNRPHKQNYSHISNTSRYTSKISRYLLVKEKSGYQPLCSLQQATLTSFRFGCFLAKLSNEIKL